MRILFRFALLVGLVASFATAGCDSRQSVPSFDERLRECEKIAFPAPSIYGRLLLNETSDSRPFNMTDVRLTLMENLNYDEHPLVAAGNPDAAGCFSFKV